MKTIKITEEEYQVLRQYWENEIEMAEETGEATEHLEERLEALDEMWSQAE